MSFETDSKYVYYLSGPIGAGKTTSLAYIGSLRTYAEWAEPRNELLGKAWPDLTPDERIVVDTWISGQFVSKNVAVLDRRAGVHIIDSRPLDPISFTDVLEMPAKAKAMIAAFGPGKSVRRVCPGQVILLTGNAVEPEAKVVGRHKESNAGVIADLQDKLVRIYPQHTLVDTSGASIHDLVRSISRIIHLGDYAPADLAGRLDELAVRGG